MTNAYECCGCGKFGPYAEDGHPFMVYAQPGWRYDSHERHKEFCLACTKIMLLSLEGRRVEDVAAMTKVTFERLPEYFIRAHSEEIGAWGANMGEINRQNAAEGLPPNTKRVILREGYFADVSPDPEMGPVIRRVTLRAEVRRSGMTIRGGRPVNIAIEIAIMPHTEDDERLIRRHCEKMTKLGVDPGKRLVAPPAAGIPFLPDNWS